MNQKANFKTVTLKDLWGVFVQRLWAIILAACICCGGFFVFNRMTFVPQYASTATLYILRQADGATASDASSDFSLALKVVNDCTYLLKSHTVLDEVISSLNLDMEYEWCKDGVPAQRDMLQCLPMEKFPRWRKSLRANKPVVISDLQRLEKIYPDEAAFFQAYGVTTLLAAPFSKRINQGFIAVDDPTRYTDDPVFLFIASYAVVLELNEIKQQQSILAATKASKYNPEDIHINFFGGMEIIGSKGTLTGEDIKADQCYLLLAYLILNHKKNFSIDTLAEIICPYDELDSPYKVVNNIVYRLRRTLSVIGLDKLVVGKNGTFQINPDYNIHTDFDRFEDACIQLKTEEKPDMRHSLYHTAINLYKGQLLPRCEHELWLMQLSMYYQSLYLQITKGYVRLKMECKDYILAQKTAIDALRFDPKDSELNMYAILTMGFQGNLSMAQTYYTAAKPYLALEHAEVIKKYLNVK